MQNLYNNIKIYYNDLDNLTKRLQDNWNDDIQFKQDEQDRLALSMILDSFDNANKNSIDIITNDFIILKDKSTENWQDLLIFDERLTDEEYKKIKFLVEYTRDYNGYCIDDIIEEIQAFKSCRWLDLNDKIKTIEY